MGGSVDRLIANRRFGEFGARKMLIAMHGLGAVLVLVGGFGLLARIGFAHGGGVGRPLVRGLAGLRTYRLQLMRRGASQGWLWLVGGDGCVVLR